MSKGSSNSRFRFPNGIVILFWIIVFVAILTYIVPAGEFERVVVNGRKVVNPDSFHYVQQTPVKVFDIFKAIPKGMTNAGALIFMILTIGAAIQLFDSTGAIKAAIFKLLDAIGEKRKGLVVAAIMVFFAALGGFPGMLEAAIPFAPLCVGIALSLGYDPLVGIAMPLVAIVIGWTAGPSNPWTVGIGQKIAELPMFSGFGYRLIIWFVLLALSIFFVLRYCKKLEKDPSSSIVADMDFSHLESSAIHERIPFTTRHLLILLTFVGTIGFILYGTFNWKWGLFEMSGTYIIGAIIGGIIAGYNSNKIAETLLEGGKAIFIGVVAVGMARGINVIMDQGNITDTIVRAVAMPLSGLPESITSIGMFIAQSIINFFIPSGSGQALVTLPIVIPVADIVGLTRQVAILAFQFGDGLSNLCYPTVGALVAFLLYTKVPFNKWLRFIMPFMFLSWGAAAVLLFIATAIGYGPF